MVAGGERGGKSLYTACELVTRVPWGRLFWIVGEDYEATHKEFEYAVEWFSKLGALLRKDVSMPQRNSWRMRLKTGQQIVTKSGKDVRKIRSEAPDGILVPEAATVPHMLFLKCFGRLGETRGWLVCSGTFEGSTGWYPQVWFDLQAQNDFYRGRSFSIPAWSNTTIFPGGRDDAEIKRLERVYSPVPGLFEEKVAGIPVPPANLVFREFRKLVHVSERSIYLPGRPVYIGVDPSDGGHPYAVVACQFEFDPQAPPEDPIDFCYVVDEIWERGKIDEEMIAEAQSRDWWRDVQGGAIDVQAKDSRRRWLSYGGVLLAARNIPQLHGIRRLHSFLHYNPAAEDSSPHLLIHPDVKGLPYEFGQYKRKDTDLLDGEMPPDLPSANQPNDSIKALWYLLYHRYGPVKAKKLPLPANYMDDFSRRERIGRWRKLGVQLPQSAEELLTDDFHAQRNNALPAPVRPRFRWRGRKP